MEPENKQLDLLFHSCNIQQTSLNINNSTTKARYHIFQSHRTSSDINNFQHSTHTTNARYHIDSAASYQLEYHTILIITKMKMLSPGMYFPVLPRLPQDIIDDHKRKMIDNWPPSHNSTKPRQWFGRTTRRFRKYPATKPTAENPTPNNEVGYCSWCKHKFWDEREYHEHATCRRWDKYESPVMAQARIWIADMQEELNQVKRARRLAGMRLASGYTAARATARHDLSNQASTLRLRLKTCETAKEQLKQDIRDAENRRQRWMVETLEQNFVRDYCPRPIPDGAKVGPQYLFICSEEFAAFPSLSIFNDSDEGSDEDSEEDSDEDEPYTQTRQPTSNSHRYRLMGGVVRGVEDAASRVTGKRCRIPRVHRYTGKLLGR